MLSEDEELIYTGTQVNYYFVCKKKLWLFSNYLEMEHSSDLVLLGKLLHETSYARELKEIQLDKIKIDFLKKGCEIHEIKRSRKMEKSHVYQLLYYLYYLKQKNIHSKGVINYPILKKKVEVDLTEEKEIDIENILKDISRILSKKTPPKAEKKSFCKSCSYYEFCWC
ncbi:MAG: CRISPR-associated protein Cas4 [Methanosarcinales archaeon]